MKGYWIALYNQIEDQGNLSKYAEAATKAILNHGGKPLVRGGDYQCLEGTDFPRTVIWEFPSYEKSIGMLPFKGLSRSMVVRQRNNK
jgi:uncharacterized protein (DUF1330 family)